MSQTLRVTPVVGLPQFTGWSHVLEHIIDSDTKCVFCFSVSGENASNVGREIVESILSIPPRSSQGLYQSIEDALSLATAQNCQLSMVSGVYRYKRSIFAAISGSIILKRGSKVGRILHTENEIAIVEGKYDLDDVFVFSTEQGRQFLSEIELQFQRGFDSDGVITAIVPALHALDDSSLSGLGFIVVVDQDSLIDVEDTASTVEIVGEDDSQSAESQPFIRMEADDSSEINESANFSENEQAVPSEENPSSKPTGVPLKQAVGSIKKFGQGLAAFLAGLLAFLVRIFTALRGLGSSKTYIGAPSNKKIVRVLIAIVAVISIVAGLIWWYFSSNSKAEAIAQATVAPFRQDLVEIQQLAESDPIPAREQASTLITTLQSQRSEAEAVGEDKKVAAFDEVLQEAQIVYQDISGKDEVSELPIFYDLRLASSDFITSLASSNQNAGYFVDREKKQAIILDLATKQVITQNLDALPAIKSVAAGPTDEQMVILAEGLYLTEMTADADPQQVKEPGDSNRDASLTGSFGTYVYVFNPQKRNIYRYAKGDEEEYSDPIGWLLDPLGVSFETVTSWAIDGEIWIGTSEGQLLRFASGRTEEFEIVGLQEPFDSTLHVATTEELDKIYVLEHENNRLVVLNKNGEFLREVKSSSLGAATGIILNQDASKVLVISGSSIFEIDA